MEYLTAIFVIVSIGLSLFLLLALKKKNNPAPIEKGTIHIVVENGQKKRNGTTQKSEIIKQAEEMFLTLQKKYLYSPVPFKVLGDFYLSKGLKDHALEKYEAMIPFLNQELSLDKLKTVQELFNLNNRSPLADAIQNHYEKDSR